MSTEVVPVQRRPRKERGLWCRKLDKKLLHFHRPVYCEPLPEDVLRCIVDMALEESEDCQWTQWTTAYTLGLVNKAFRRWVLHALYKVIKVTSPAHLDQINIISTVAGDLTTSVRCISLVGLEMHIYGALDRKGGLYKDLEAFLSRCENLETVLYDFKRVPLPFSVPPRSLKQVRWTHPSLDGWRGCEPAINQATHLRIDCAQNAPSNAVTFDTLTSSDPAPCPYLTHLSFCVDARLPTDSSITMNFIRSLLKRQALLRVVVFVAHCDSRPMLDAYKEIEDHRLSFLTSRYRPSEWTCTTDWG
ncbi:hypothetical protein JB92DRAFT_1486505 [Gautieria morchelliformis]|nr:hypothetical protein JB92DRAFT_1486505 [Gautieria morchelliformis]